jgi:hypothetical protein
MEMERDLEGREGKVGPVTSILALKIVDNVGACLLPRHTTREGKKKKKRKNMWEDDIHDRSLWEQPRE